ncbi:MAG: hypothetical protein FJ130_06785 [Deltaproteobacteria bacterium]|nr:hypothetical protein [Deltaproteobacteria bacterium]
MKISLERLCKFYDHSKCLIHNNFCDLDCSRLSDEKGFGLDETRNKIKKWRNEELDKELKKTESRLR